MNTFTVNGVTYTAKAFDFNMVCDFEDMGISVADMGKKSNAFMRAYFSVCAGVPVEVAGKMIEEHIIKGGDMSTLANALAKEIEASDFFQTLIKNATKETSKKDKKAENSEK